MKENAGDALNLPEIEDKIAVVEKYRHGDGLNTSEEIENSQGLLNVISDFRNPAHFSACRGC